MRKNLLIATRVTITVVNDLSQDQRVHRIASTLQAHGYEVWVIGRQLPDSLPITARPYHTRRLKLLFTRGKLFYLEFNIRLFFFLLFFKVDVLKACDLDTLLANFLVSCFRRSGLVYDSHEYFTEVPEVVGRPLTQRIWLTLEKWIFPRLRHAYTVNDSIAQVYQTLYQVPVHTIRNVPLPKAIEARTDKENIIIYEGMVNVGRGIDLMIRAMKYLPGYVFWVVGKGDVLEELKALTHELGLEKQVIFKGFVPFDSLSLLTRQAKVGVSLFEEMGKSHHFISPNKLYDYIQARVPVIGSDMPEQRKIIESFDTGKILLHKDRDPQLLADMILSLTQDPQQYQELVDNCDRAAQILNWEAEKEKLLKIYEDAQRK
ncbi:MAG: glycosyltransferase family 4 protein [Bacteroidota bacterium]